MNFECERIEIFMVSAGVRSESGRACPVWPGAGLEPWRSGRCSARDFSGVDAKGRAARKAGALLCAELSEPGVEPSAESLAAADARIGIASLVRAVFIGNPV